LYPDSEKTQREERASKVRTFNCSTEERSANIFRKIKRDNKILLRPCRGLYGVGRRPV